MSESKNKTISMDKKYRTGDGSDVRILCTDKKHPVYTVVALIKAENIDILETFTSEGKCFKNKSPSSYDLIELTPYDDFKIDDKVLVSNASTNPKYMYKGYFAGVTKEGLPTTWVSGLTSFTADNSFLNRIEWNYCIKFEEASEE